ncbi:hypothetical protein [Patulibacter minatonensis]|uniref:hypothetical protein n=1 Tax=Patulibacter minatonensis TaxID=298163 RepID=UPI00047C6F82|nr:hypothetical protein [Patulibacter minatonensis]
MSGLKEHRASLDAAQRAVLDAKVVGGERPALEWLGLLGPVLAHDVRIGEALERVRRRTYAASSTFVGGWIVAIVSGVAGVAPLGVAAGVVVVLALLTIVALRVERRRLRTQDLEGEPLRLTAALLPILAEDAAPGTPVALDLDLTGHRTDAKKLGKSDTYRKGAYHAIVDTFYDDPFLRARVRFADGAQVSIAGRVQSRVSRKTKRSQSNKIKTKIKTKTRTTYEVDVRFPDRNYAAVPTTSGGPSPSGTDRERVRTAPGRTAVRERRVIKAVGPRVALDAAHVVDLVAHAYDRVDPTRRKKLR